MAAKSDTAVRGTAARADCGSRDGAAGRARRYAREREDACVGEAAFEGEAARIGEEGGRHPMAGAGHVRPFRSEIVRRARSDATRRGRRGYFARRARLDATRRGRRGYFARRARLDATRRGRRGYFARRACAAVPVAGGPRMFLAPCRLGSGEKSGEGRIFGGRDRFCAILSCSGRGTGPRRDESEKR